MGTREFLISESVRGEGAILLNSKGERFVNELLPRDVVANAIFAEMKKEGSKHVWLSLAPIPEEEIKTHFPNIYQRCLDEGYDGKMEAKLNISSRKQIAQFIESVRTGKSVELMHITGGHHYHTVRADSEESLDQIEAELSKRNCIAPGN